MPAHMNDQLTQAPAHKDEQPVYTVSIVIPCYNEQDNILPMYRRVRDALVPTGERFEIIFVDNGSTDRSEALFRDLARQDSAVRVLFLSRNFGSSQYSYTAGTRYARGQAVVCIDGDQQDPPELIPDFLKKWREGFEVVYGIRTKRRGGIFRRIGYKLFYRIFDRLAYVKMPLDASDFGLMDRRVVNVLNAMPERGRFLRGMRAWVGFRQTGIPYVRDERHAGVTSISFWGNFRWAKNGIFAFSYLPLEFISLLGFLCTMLAVVGAVFYFILVLTVPNQPRGFATIILVILFLGGIQLLCLSIIGEYLGRIFEEVKQRPHFVVRETLNIEVAHEHHEVCD